MAERRMTPVDMLRRLVAFDTTSSKSNLALIEDVHAGDVAREQVGGALHAAERAPDGTGECAGQGGLADPRHVLDEEVTACEHGDEGLLDGLGLADDDVGDALEDWRNLARECAWRVLGDHARSIASDGRGARDYGPTRTSRVAAFTPTAMAAGSASSGTRLSRSS